MAMAENITLEEAFLLDRTVRCPMCDKVFHTKKVKSARARRIGADRDLRPHFEHIDPTKYDVDSCPFCGYTAVSRYFSGENITSVQRALLKEGVCDKFTSPATSEPELPRVYSYEEAISRYKRALYNALVKNARASERAYTCLKLSWLYRAKVLELESSGQKNVGAITEARAEEQKFYVQAYEGFVQAVATENPPICGMDQNSLDYLMAQMAFQIGKIQEASKIVSALLLSKTCGNKVKDMARDLKDEIIAELKKA